MNKVFRLGSICLGLVILLPVIYEIFSMAGTILLGEELIAHNPWLTTVVSYTPVFILVILYLKATLEPLKKYGFRKNTQYIFLSIGLGISAAILQYIADINEVIYQNSAGEFINIFQALNVPVDPSFGAAIGFLFAWAIIGPLTEDFLFRGLIQTELHKHTKEWSAILIVVFLEILLHGPTILSNTYLSDFWSMRYSMSYIILYGIASSWVYAKTRSLVGPLIIHALGNGGQLIIYWILM